MIRLVPLGEIQPVQTERLRSAYTESFPVAEQRPWEQILSPVSPLFAPYSIEHAGEVAGAVTLWRLEPCWCVEHLFTLPAVRGLGVGAAAVQAVLRELPAGCPLILEAEFADAHPMAARRLAFYERLGFRVQPYPYIQPPYVAGGASIPLHILSTVPLSEEAFVAVRDALYTHVYCQL